MWARTIPSDIWVESEIDIRTIDDCSDCAGHDDTDKHKSKLSEAEPIHWWVDERKDFEERVVDSINKTCVETSIHQ